MNRLQWYERRDFQKNPSETRDLIDGLDFSAILKKLCANYERGGYQWSIEKALYAIEEYKKFLFVATQADPPEKILELKPSPMVDIVWHTHILFTMQYHADCEQIFGFYFHHEPSI